MVFVSWVMPPDRQIPLCVCHTQAKKGWCKQFGTQEQYEVANNMQAAPSSIAAMTGVVCCACGIVNDRKDQLLINCSLVVVTVIWCTTCMRTTHSSSSHIHCRLFVCVFLLCVYACFSISACVLWGSESVSRISLSTACILPQAVVVSHCCYYCHHYYSMYVRMYVCMYLFPLAIIITLLLMICPPDKTPLPSGGNMYEGVTWQSSMISKDGCLCVVFDWGAHKQPQDTRFEWSGLSALHPVCFVSSLLYSQSVVIMNEAAADICDKEGSKILSC